MAHGSDQTRGDETRERLAAIGEIAAEVAHELRNVLQVISASAYLARQDPPGAELHIAKIERNARLAHSIVDDLMSLARGEPTHAEPVLVAELLVAARSEMPAGCADWNDSLTPRDVRMRVHHGLFTRVIHALYENSIQICAPRPPRITTYAWHDSSWGAAVLEISDDGPGVSPAIAATIFDPLVSGRNGGSGLGLALAKRIVGAHGGTIALVDPNDAVAAASFEHIGATFRIVLPFVR